MQNAMTPLLPTAIVADRDVPLRAVWSVPPFVRMNTLIKRALRLCKSTTKSVVAVALAGFSWHL